MSQPTLAQRKNGHWYVRWYDSEAGRTRRSSLRTTNPTTARKRFAGWLLEDEVQEVGGVTAAQCLDAYDAEHVERKVVAKDIARIHIKHVREHFGGINACDVDNTDVQEFIEARGAGVIGRPSGNGTIRRELAVLIAAMNHCARFRRFEGFTKADVPPIPLPEAPDSKDRWLTDAEIKELLKWCRWDGATRRFTPDRRVERFTLIAMETGARKSFIETLTWAQVDLGAGLIDFNELGKPKAKKKKRPIVPISDDLKPHLMRWAIEDREGIEHVLGAPGSVRRAFRTACDKAGLPGVTPHTLRHTWATHAAIAGIPFHSIAAVLGNSEAVVRSTYAHHNPEYLRDAINFRKGA